MNYLRKQIPLFELTLAISILSIHLYAAFSDAYNFPNNWFMRDDAYYYFKVAQNITEGLGSSFDGINLTNGYHPLWMLVCIPIFFFARFDLILPLRILLMVMAVLNAATAIMIYRLVKSNLSHAVAIATASFWAFNYYIHTTVYESGLETPLAAFSITLLIYKLSIFEKERRIKSVTVRQIVVLAVLATFAMFSRLDLVFLAVICGFWIVFRDRPIRFILPLDLLIIFASMTSSVAFRTGMEQYNTIYAASAVEAVILVIVIKTILLYFFGTYLHPFPGSIWKLICHVGTALTISSALSASLFFILVELGIGKSFPRSAFVIDWGISLLLILLLRLAAYWFGDRKIKTNGHRISPLGELQIYWKKWLIEGGIYYGIVGVTLAIYMLYNKISFGTSTPVSGQVKRWWGTFINTVYESPAPDWTSFFGISYDKAYDAWQPASSLFLWMAKKIYPLFPGSNTLDERYYISMVIFLILALIIVFTNKRRAKQIVSNMALIPLAAGCGIQILSYTTTAYGGLKEWYWISQMVFTTLAGAVLIYLLIHLFQHLSCWALDGKARYIQFTLKLASIVFSIFMAYHFSNYVKSIMRYNYFSVDLPYMGVLPYIESNTSPGSIIGMTGGGNVGYFIQDRTIVNMDGLINSYDYFLALQNQQAPGYLGQHGVTIVFASPRLLSFPPYNKQFAPYFENYSEYGGKNLMYLLEKPKYKPKY